MIRQHGRERVLGNRVRVFSSSVEQRRNISVEASLSGVVLFQRVVVADVVQDRRMHFTSF